MISQKDYDSFCDTVDHYPSVVPGDYTILIYALGYAGESGESANKIKKIFRDDGAVISPDRRKMIIKELGGAYWYYSRLCKAIGVTPDEIMQANYEELSGRKERGTIKGDGDDR